MPGYVSKRRWAVNARAQMTRPAQNARFALLFLAPGTGY